MTAFKQWEVFSANVLKARRAKGIKSNAVLASKAGISLTQLTQWMNGKQNPSGRLLEKLSAALDVPPSALLGTEPVKTTPPPAPMDLTKEVWIEVKGRVWATPFRLSAGRPLGHIKAWPGEQQYFALEVEGDSMLPIYKPGWFIICKPDPRELSPYSMDEDSAYVPYDMIKDLDGEDAVMFHEGETTLKRIKVVQTQGPKYDLQMVALNPQYPTVTIHRGDVWMMQAVVKRIERDPTFLR